MEIHLTVTTRTAAMLTCPFLPSNFSKQNAFSYLLRCPQGQAARTGPEHCKALSAAPGRGNPLHGKRGEHQGQLCRARARRRPKRGTRWCWSAQFCTEVAPRPGLEPCPSFFTCRNDRFGRSGAKPRSFLSVGCRSWTGRPGLRPPCLVGVS